jgi:hypothetical protein
MKTDINYDEMTMHDLKMPQMGIEHAIKQRQEERINKIADSFKLLFEATLDMEYTVELSKNQDFEVALVIIDKIGGYNEFDTETIKILLKTIDEIIPRFYMEGNPNNGKREYNIIIGRESSPVIYIKYLGESQINVKRIQEIAKDAKADEIQIIKNGKCEYISSCYETIIRLWWD